jgi:hypothetical protein
MPRIIKTALLTFMILIGFSAVVWGIHSFLATPVGGLIIDTTEGPSYPLDIYGWLTRLFYAVVSVLGLAWIFLAVFFWANAKARQ